MEEGDVSTWAVHVKTVQEVTGVGRHAVGGSPEGEAAREVYGRRCGWLKMWTLLLHSLVA